MLVVLLVPRRGVLAEPTQPIGDDGVSRWLNDPLTGDQVVRTGGHSEDRTAGGVGTDCGDQPESVAWLDPKAGSPTGTHVVMVRQ